MEKQSKILQELVEKIEERPCRHCQNVRALAPQGRNRLC